MRPDVWSVFRERFGIETINELYAATDGVSSSFNANKGDFGLGAIGVRGLYWKWVNGSNEKRVKIDVVTEEIQRGKDGFRHCMRRWRAGRNTLQNRSRSTRCRVRWILQKKGPETEDPRRVSKGRYVVSVRGYDALRPGWLSILRGPSGRYIPMEERKCEHERSQRCAWEI